MSRTEREIDPRSKPASPNLGKVTSRGTELKPVRALPKALMPKLSILLIPELKLPELKLPCYSRREKLLQINIRVW